MNKLIFTTFALLTPLLCFSAEPPKAKDLIEVKLKITEECIENFFPESGLDIQQYYYMLGCKQAYYECLEIIKILERDSN